MVAQIRITGQQIGEVSMGDEQMMVHAVDPGENWLYRVSGICALVIGLVYLITIALYAHM
jgi:hypothetical protein